MTTAEARELYLFWHRRPLDKQAWPVVYESKELAETCKFRVGPVVPVMMPPPPQDKSSDASTAQ